MPSTAVLIACFNEEATLAKIVADFRAALPAATIYVYDNNSSEADRAAGAVVRLFGDRFTDVFSGDRASSHKFMKSLPGLGVGFEGETEITTELRLPTSEIETAHGERPEGSVSKPNTIRDGFCETALVPRFPTAIATSGRMVLSWWFLIAGLVLASVARGRLEVKRIAYLSLSAPPDAGDTSPQA